MTSPVIRDCPSLNFDSRDGCPVSLLVLHYTGMQTPQAAFERLCDPAAKVSAHYIVDEEGVVHRLVDESNRAWHAGASYWRGARNINQSSIGIEIVNPGHEWGYRSFPHVQMKSVIALCRDILTRHPIPAHNVVGHSDIAPARKEDPGELFDWAWLAREGVGLWPKRISGSRFQVSGNSVQTSNLKPETLSSYGYDTADLPRTIAAFQRHFRQNNINGQWDNECQMILDALLEMA